MFPTPSRTHKSNHPRIDPSSTVTIEISLSSVESAEVWIEDISVARVESVLPKDGEEWFRALYVVGLSNKKSPNSYNILWKIRCFFQISVDEIKLGSRLFHFWNQQLEGFQKSIGLPRLSLKSPKKWYLGLNRIQGTVAYMRPLKLRASFWAQ